jgi:hypothetical protein
MRALISPSLLRVEGYDNSHWTSSMRALIGPTLVKIGGYETLIYSPQFKIGGFELSLALLCLKLEAKRTLIGPSLLR